MSQSPAVSVLMAAFNAERYLPQALDSIQAQSLRDWELIICDDGSTDATGEICQRYADRDRRIQWIRHPRNRGMSAARNSAFARARGRFVAMMDADDHSAPDRLRRQLPWAKRFPNDVVTTGCTHIGCVRRAPCDLYVPSELTNAALWVTTPVCTSSLMMTRTMYAALGGYSDAIRHDFEDLDFLLRAALAGHHLRILPAELYAYRIYPQSHCGRDRKGFFQRYNGFVSRMWALHLATHEARCSLFQLAQSGLRSSRWPAGRSRHARRKAAALGIMLADRFAAAGEYQFAKRLLREAIRVCWWRVDAHLSRMTVRMGLSWHVTTFRERILPRLIVRRHAEIVAFV